MHNRSIKENPMRHRKANIAVIAALTLAALTGCAPTITTDAGTGNSVDIVHVSGASGTLQTEPVVIVHVEGSAGDIDEN
jgi:hypothetical protein